MKYKTTAKAIREGACNPRSVGYCDLQYLLNNHSPIAYTCGVYGWNFDVYEVYGVTICTGYRGMVGPRCAGIAEYEKKAEEILLPVRCCVRTRLRKIQGACGEYPCKVPSPLLLFF